MEKGKKWDQMGTNRIVLKPHASHNLHDVHNNVWDFYWDWYTATPWNFKTKLAYEPTKNRVKLLLFWRYPNFSKLMRTIHTSYKGLQTNEKFFHFSCTGKRPEKNSCEPKTTHPRPPPPSLFELSMPKGTFIGHVHEVLRWPDEGWLSRNKGVCRLTKDCIVGLQIFSIASFAWCKQGQTWDILWIWIAVASVTNS